MVKKSTIIQVLLLAFTAGMIGGCKHRPEVVDDNDGNGGGGTDTLVVVNPNTCDPDSVYFVNTIQPLLNSMCAVPECHDAITAEDGVVLTNYSTIMQQVEPFDLNSSDLWDKGIMDSIDPMPPAGSPQLTQEQIAQVQTWIMQGALNNSCHTDCDPSAFSYGTNLAPIIDLFCDDCHGGNSPEAGLVLGTHAQLVNMVQNSNNDFMDCLNGTNDAPIMPPNTLGLSNCYKQQFQNWIETGMPNN